MSSRATARQALADERGFTLSELLISTTLMLIVMFAVLDVFEGFVSTASRGEKRSEAEDQARFSTDRLARELRNLASPAFNGNPVEVAAPYDLVFRTIDRLGPNTGANKANIRRVRYCLPANGRLQKQWQTWTSDPPPARPDTTACPGTGWTGTENLIRLENRNTSGVRPLFEYDSTDIARISSVRTDLFAKAGGGSEVRLRTAVGLRNQNRTPTASFTATPAGSNVVLLNGSASLDPEGQQLEYLWYVDGVTEPIARGPIVQWTAPGVGNRTFQLKVVDPGELSNTAPSQTVSIS